jgi:hypothetical protein
VVAIVAISAAALLKFRNEEPTYQGRRLSEWVIDVSTYHFGIRTNVAQATVPVKAVLEIGTNALPWMVHWVASEPTGQYAHLRWQIPVLNKRAVRETVLVTGSCDMLNYYETNTAPAIPLITQQLQRLHPSPAVEKLGFTLLKIGSPAAVAALCNCITNTKMSVDNRLLLIYKIESYWSARDRNMSIEAALTNCLADPSPEIRGAARRCLQPRQQEAQSID